MNYLFKLPLNATEGRLRLLQRTFIEDFYPQGLQSMFLPLIDYNPGLSSKVGHYVGNNKSFYGCLPSHEFQSRAIV